MSAQHVPVRPSSCLSYISCPMCLCLYPWPFLHTSLPDINKGSPHSGSSLFYAYFHLIYHNFCRYLFSTSLCFYESETALFRLYSSITATISLLFWILFCSSASSTLWSESGVTIFNGSKLYSKSFRDVLPITNTSLSTDTPFCTPFSHEILAQNGGFHRPPPQTAIAQIRMSTAFSPLSPAHRESPDRRSN